MVRVQCPYCKRVYRTELEAFGLTAICTHCDESFRIGDSRPAFREHHDDLAEESWIGVEPPKEKQEAPHCIFCDAMMEAGTAVCPACGRNQITGVVHKVKTQPKAEEEKIPITAMIPWRPVIAVISLLVIAGGVLWISRGLRRSVDTFSETLSDQTLVLRAVKFHREQGDPTAFAETFRGQATDGNLPMLLEKLNTADAGVRQAVAMLIGCGSITRLDLLVDATRNAKLDHWMGDVLEAMGPHRLVELSNQESENARKNAAELLVTLCGLKRTDETLERLSKRSSSLEKVQTLNELCGTAMNAVGPFVVEIGDARSPFEVQVTQVGPVFYLQAGRDEFRTMAMRRPPAFDIPVERWARATGEGVNLETVRSLLFGKLELRPAAVGWAGRLRIRVDQSFMGRLPGFLPIENPKGGDSIDLPVRLVRQSR